MTVTISGGNKLQAFLATVSKQKADAQVGFFEDAKYNDGTQVAQVAVDNEYGNPVEHRPPRPFMSDTVKFNKSKWFETFTKVINSQGKDIDVRQALTTVALQAQGDVKMQITKANQYYPANAPFTIQKKGKDSVLRDTNVMLNSVMFEVK